MGVTGDRTVERVGVFGGTFDPPHAGHVAIVTFVLSHGLVDKVLVIPTGQPWLRAGRPTASAGQRLEMARLAFSASPGVEVLDIEVERAGPTYTVDTLRELRAGGEDALRLVLILGADAAKSLAKWHECEQLLKMCELLIVGRPGEGGWRDLPVDHPARRATYVEGPLVEVSATEIRRRLAAAADVSGMMPDAVAAYVREHGLYGLGADDYRETNAE